MKQATTVTRIDTRRVQIIDLEDYDYSRNACAPEGAWQPHEPKQAPRIPRIASPWIGPRMGVAALVAVAILSTIAWIYK